MTLAVLIGILGPLLVAAASWPVMARTYRREPARLTSVMMAAFGIKMAFFAAYVTLAIAVFAVSPVPFVSSFVVSFVAAYTIEAIGLHRMLRGKSA